MKTKSYSGINVETKGKIPPADAKDIGKILKEKREDMGISIERVQLDTHITPRYIHAIENGDFSQLPAEVYLLGSLKRYSKYLGLDPKMIVDAYNEKAHPKTAAENTKIQNAKNESIRKVKETRKENPKMSVVILGILLIGAVSLTLMNMPKKENHVKEVKESDQKALVPEKVIPSTLKLMIKSRNSSWVKVYSDEKVIFEGVIPQGVEKEWEASKEFQVKIGYVPALEVKLNGMDIDIRKGAVQEVNSVTLNWDSLKN